MHPISLRVSNCTLSKSRISVSNGEGLPRRGARGGAHGRPRAPVTVRIYLSRLPPCAPGEGDALEPCPWTSPSALWVLMHYFIIINIIKENVLFCYCLDKVGVKGLIRWSQGGSVSSELRPNVRDSPGWAGLGKGKGAPRGSPGPSPHTHAALVLKPTFIRVYTGCHESSLDCKFTVTVIKSINKKTKKLDRL